MGKTGPVLLLVEGDESNASLFQKALSQTALHWRFVHVKHGMAAVQHMIFQGFPNLLVTTLSTTKLNALDLVEWTRSMKSSWEVAFLVWDVQPSDQQKADFSKYNVSHFLNKKASREQIKGVLARLIADIEAAGFDPGSE